MMKKVPTKTLLQEENTCTRALCAMKDPGSLQSRGWEGYFTYHKSNCTVNFMSYEKPLEDFM